MKRNARKKRPSYQSLEPRKLLAVIVVNTAIDDGGAVTDGLVSFREAVIAANTNAPFGDAPAGDDASDEIVFAPELDGQSIVLEQGIISISEGVAIRDNELGLTIDGGGIRQMFDIDTQEGVVFKGLTLTNANSAIEKRGDGLLRLTDVTVTGVGIEFLNLVPSVRVTGGSLEVLRSTFSESNQAIGATDTEVGVYESTFENNFGASGAGILAVNSTAFVFESDFIENRSSGNDPFGNGAGLGGAIFVDENSSVQVVGGTFDGNRAGRGGAIWNAGSLTVRGGTEIANGSVNGSFTNTSGEVGAFGGGIYSDGDLRVENVVIRANQAQHGAGVYVGSGSAFFYQARIDGNEATIEGGGLMVASGEARLIDSHIVANRVDGRGGLPFREFDFGQGGGIFIGPNRFSTSDIAATVEFFGGSIVDNQALNRGGGIANVGDNSTVVVANGTLIQGNSVTSLGIPVNFSLPAFGGGVYSSGDLQMYGVQIRNNSSTFDGGGIQVDGGVAVIASSTIAANSAERNGGGINVAAGDVTLFGSTLGGLSPAEGNFAGQFRADGTQGFGGGAFVAGNVEARFVMTAGALGFNTAKISGGGIATFALGTNLPVLRSVVRLQEVSVLANRALVADGGGIYNDGSHLELRDSVFAQNTSRNGAAIFAESGSMTLTQTVVRMNEARRTGGGIFDRGFLRLTESLVSENRAKYHPDVFEF